MNWRIIDDKDISLILDQRTMCPIFIYKGIHIKVNRTFIADCRAQTEDDSLIEDYILNEYNNDRIVIRDNKLNKLL